MRNSSYGVRTDARHGSVLGKKASPFLKHDKGGTVKVGQGGGHVFSGLFEEDGDDGDQTAAHKQRGQKIVHAKEELIVAEVKAEHQARSM